MPRRPQPGDIDQSPPHRYGAIALRQLRVIRVVLAVDRSLPVYPDEQTFSVSEGTSQTGQKPTWCLSFYLRQRLRDFARTIDKKLRDRAERAVLQGHNSVWHAGYR